MAANRLFSPRFAASILVRIRALSSEVSVLCAVGGQMQSCSKAARMAQSDGAVKKSLAFIKNFYYYSN